MSTDATAGAAPAAPVSRKERDKSEKKEKKKEKKHRKEKGSSSSSSAAAAAAGGGSGKSDAKADAKAEAKAAKAAAKAGAKAAAAAAAAADGGAKVEDDYKLGKELGRGAFSIVVRAKHLRTGEEVAIKCIHKKDLAKDAQRNLQREIDILRRIKHPSIIALKALYDTKDRLYLVMELVEGGELFDKIIEQGSYSERDAARLVHKIVSAIQYLHSNDIVHRDLKPENLLLRTPDDVTEVCIADFGLSKVVGTQTMMQTACGTPSYVAPEVLTATGYGPEVDLWSIGVITYILLCGFPPFYGETVPEIFEQIMAGKYDFPEQYWSRVSSDAKAFIKKLLVVDPAKRMTGAQALAHKWLKAHAAAAADGGGGGSTAAGAAAGEVLNVKEALSKEVKYRREQSKVTKRSLSTGV